MNQKIPGQKTKVLENGIRITVKKLPTKTVVKTYDDGSQRTVVVGCKRYDFIVSRDGELLENGVITNGKHANGVLHQLEQKYKDIP